MSERTLGIIGGSGLYDLSGLEQREEVCLTTPFGDPSDRILLGLLGDRPVAFLPRHGGATDSPPVGSTIGRTSSP